MTPDEIKNLSDDELDALILANEVKLAEIRGRLSAMREHASQDQRLAEVLRQEAWVASGRAGVSIKDGRLAVPTGWPEGVDAADVVNRELDRLFAPALGTSAEPSARPAGKNVERLRALINGGATP